MAVSQLAPALYAFPCARARGHWRHGGRQEQFRRRPSTLVVSPCCMAGSAAARWSRPAQLPPHKVAAGVDLAVASARYPRDRGERESMRTYEVTHDTDDGLFRIRTKESGRVLAAVSSDEACLLRSSSGPSWATALTSSRSERSSGHRVSKTWRSTARSTQPERKSKSAGDRCGMRCSRPAAERRATRTGCAHRPLAALGRTVATVDPVVDVPAP